MVRGQCMQGMFTPLRLYLIISISPMKSIKLFEINTKNGVGTPPFTSQIVISGRTAGMYTCKVVAIKRSVCAMGKRGPSLVNAMFLFAFTVESVNLDPSWYHLKLKVLIPEFWLLSSPLITIVSAGKGLS